MCLTEGALQAYVDGEVKGAERQQLLEHLATCTRCRELADAAVARRKRIDGLLAVQTADAPGDVAAVAVARFRERLVADDGVAGFKLKLGAYGAATLATVVALALLAVFLGSRASVRSRNAGSGFSRIEAAGGDPMSSVRSGHPSQSVEPPPRAVRTAIPPRLFRSPALHRAAPAGATADNPYFLLTADPTPPELGIVVRVTVPLSMLTGDAGPMGSLGEPGIEADVLVGQDGRPRAIRFVNQTQPIGGK